MPLYLAIIITLLLVVGRVFYGGYLYLIILVLIVSAYNHLTAQLKTDGKWELDTNRLTEHLMIIGIVTFLALIFPFFPLTFRNLLNTAAIVLGLCGYSILMSLKKVSRSSESSTTPLP